MDQVNLLSLNYDDSHSLANESERNLYHPKDFLIYVPMSLIVNVLHVNLIFLMRIFHLYHIH